MKKISYFLFALLMCAIITSLLFQCALAPRDINPVFRQVKKIFGASWPESAFGDSVAIDGDYAIVEQWKEDDTNKGIAFIFRKDEGGTDHWGQVKKITPDTLGNKDGLGKVALFGDYALIAGPYEDRAGSDRGEVYLLHKDAGAIGDWGLEKP